VIFEDLLRGRIDMMDNYNDIVLIKKDGLPTYHLAHIVDDHLMRMSHIIRAEEWMPSVPLHLQLFAACGLQAPIYCHLAQILKLDEGKKRKLSKRKDPEANVAYFFENGYAVQGILEYLINLIDSKFEDWQKENLDKTYVDFEIKLEDMNKAGALFDLVKLQSVNNGYLSRIPTQRLYEESLARAQTYRPELAQIMLSDPAYTQAALNIERHTPKDPKRFSTYADIESQLRFFFDTEREKLQATKPALPEIITHESMQKFIPEYMEKLDLTMSVEDRFAQLKEIGKTYGFASSNAEFKEGGYIGKTGDLAMFLRIQLCCATQTPDLYSVMQVMGKERMTHRLLSF
jgi:glutamyl-tRNA synthetase